MNRLWHNEMTYQNRKIIIDTSMVDGRWETIVMYSNGHELENPIRESDKNTATENHFETVRRWREKADSEPLTGKYLKLSEDLNSAFKKAVEDCADGSDGGTCNFDAPALYLPRWNAERVEKAAKQAGHGCFTWNSYGEKRYVIALRLPYQGEKRSRIAEHMNGILKAMGYDSFMYYQMD